MLAGIVAAHPEYSQFCNVCLETLCFRLNTEIGPRICSVFENFFANTLRPTDTSGISADRPWAWHQLLDDALCSAQTIVLLARIRLAI